jgi:predicted RND superfamily exporter protein
MDIARIIIAVVTLLFTLAFLGLTIWSLTIPHFGMAVVCLALTAGFGLFVHHDYKHFFGVKTDEKTK